MAEEFAVQYQLVFFSTLVLLLLLERVRAFQRQPVQMSQRWTSNIGLFLIGNVVTSLVIPVGVFAFALNQPPGLMERGGVPVAAQFLLTFLFLDAWRYWEHRVFHFTPLLWRIHLVHHTDTQIDVTTSERHHPFEFLLSSAVLLALIAVVGLPAPAVGLYLLTATVVALYSHSNLQLPAWLESRLNLIFVTPGVHTVHHSELQEQTDSNYGTVLTIWDRMFGSFVDPARAKIPNFGLGYFHQRKDSGLASVLLQPFLFDRNTDLSHRGRDAVPSDPIDPPSATPRAATMPGWKNAILGGTAGILLALFVLWPTVLDLTSIWRHNEAYQYAWLVLPMLVYVLVWDRQVASKSSPRPDFTGVVVAAGASACWGLATLMNIDVGRQLALVLMMQGITMAMLGWRAYWHLFPALALMFLMVPSGDVLQPVLRLLTVHAIELFAVVANLPHTVDGFVISIGTNRYIVVDECSGLSFVTLGLFLGYSFGLLLYRSFYKIAALAAAGAVLGVFSNVLRVNAIVLMDWIRGSQMELTAHGHIQWIALFITLGLLFYVLSGLKADSSIAAQPMEPSEPPNVVRPWAPVFAGLSVLLIAGTVAGLPNGAALPTHDSPMSLAPKNVLGWELASRTATWSADPKSDNETLTLTYRRGDQDMHVVIVQALSPASKLQESLLLPADKGVWRERRLQKESNCVASDCLTLLHTTWQKDTSPRLRHVFHAYSIDDFTTDSKFALRAAHGWHRLTGKHSHPRLMGLAFEGATPTTPEIAAAFRQLQTALRAENP